MDLFLRSEVSRERTVAKIVSLSEAIGQLVHDGTSIALEGFSHLVPFAAGHEIIRQQRRQLTLIRMVPDIIGDQMIGAGCVQRLVFSWAGNPGVGSLHRFRDAVEHGWPVPLALEEHTHAGLAARYVAGASGLPFTVLRAYSGTSLVEHVSHVRFIDDPFGGEPVAAVSAIRPDVAIVHAQRADGKGNVQIWGVLGVQKEAILAARYSIVTVEEIVDRLPPQPGAVFLPSWALTYIVHAPGGSYPSYS
ncbi:MAG TPA: CoA-transferase, partial [Candidatus Limnocylindrales bacterium]|nr:CoA-transferase [Candidatus Limnocylindrales bacterium]